MSMKIHGRNQDRICGFWSRIPKFLDRGAGRRRYEAKRKMRDKKERKLLVMGEKWEMNVSVTHPFLVALPELPHFGAGSELPQIS